MQVAPAPVLSPAPAVEEAGTPEEVWACWPLLGNLPLLDLTGCRRALVLAPRPGDAVLGLGGSIAMLAATGVPVTVVFATDGEPERARRRVDESKAALSALGHGCSGTLRAVRLRIPAGGLQRAERNATTLLTGLLRPGDWCFSTWEGDGTADHDAAGRIAQEAARRARARALSYPLRTWHRSTPEDPDPPWGHACRVDLTGSALLRKGRAMNCYQAAMEPAELAHFTRTYEVVFP
jgi:LmbE family N-acetylglucosaminyl deacetylase